jgi:hypothetical protein
VLPPRPDERDDGSRAAAHDDDTDQRVNEICNHGETSLTDRAD